MEVVAWILAAAFAAIAGYLALRQRSSPYPDAVERLAAEIRSGGAVPAPDPEDPPEVAELRGALAGSGGKQGEEDRDPGEEALRGLFRFVEGAVLAPLEESLASSGSGGRDARLENAVDALRDLAFYATQDRATQDRATRDRTQDGGPAGPGRSENLPAVVQAVTREYTLETGVPVRFSGPPGALPVRIGPERFKDALYLLLANAGHFGKGGTVEVVTEADADVVRLRIRDRGPGFSEEALERAFDPFWSTEPDALGLGLTYARRALEEQGARLRIGNAEEGGGEVVILLSPAR